MGAGEVTRELCNTCSSIQYIICVCVYIYIYMCVYECMYYVCMYACVCVHDLGERRGYTTYARAQSFPSTTTCSFRTDTFLSEGVHR